MMAYALTFFGVGIYFLLELISNHMEVPVPSSLHRLFQQKTHVNPPSFLFFALNRNTPARSTVSSRLAGRFSIVFRAGSWRDLHV